MAQPHVVWMFWLSADAIDYRTEILTDNRKSGFDQ